MSTYATTIKNMFRVIYAPNKAFKEIMQSPKYIGPLLILILFTAANTGFIYIAMSKTHLEQTLPIGEELDKWTENRTFWSTETVGANITENNVDYINGTYYGNKSIEFSAINTKHISMQLSDIGTVDCSEQGYQNLTLRIKWTSPDSKPENVSIRLNSSASAYFYYDLTDDFSNSTVGEWNNVTIPFRTEKCVNIGEDASWKNISGTTLEFAWADDSNITLLIDGLFFRGIFKPLTETASANLYNFSIIYFMQFVIQWVILSGLIYVMTRAFGAKTVWRPLLVLVGFTFITLFVQALIDMAAFSTLPKLYYPLELIGGVGNEGDIAYNKLLEETWLVSLVSRYLQIIVYMWTILLCAIAIRLLCEFSWSKSFLISTVAYLVSLLVTSLLTGI